MFLHTLALRRRLIVIASATFALVACVTQAHAGNMILQIQQGAAVQNFVGGTNLVSTLGVVNVGDYRIQIVSGASNNPGSGIAGVAVMDITTTFVQRLTSNSTEDLIIRILSSDFSDPADPLLYLGGGVTANFTGINSLGSSVTFSSFFDDANTTVYGNGAGTTPLSLVSTGGNVIMQGDSTTIAVLNTGGPFSLSSITNINLTQDTGVTLRSTGSTILQNTPFGPPNAPEPASIALACVGLLGFGGYARRKMKALA